MDVDELDSKTCEGCSSTKALCEFYLAESGKPWNKCKGCVSEHRAEYRSTVTGFLAMLNSAAKQAAKQRLKKGRIQAGVHRLTAWNMEEMWEDQEGKCYYSSIPMTTMHNSDWQCSLERLDVNIGYVRSNVVLCCCEFNNAYQWSLGKVRRMFDILRDTSVTVQVDFYPTQSG